MAKPEYHLRKSDAVLAAAMKKIVLRPRQPEKDRFRALVRAILGQQISTKAADSITARFQALFPGAAFPSASQVLKMPDKKLRAAGLSRAKASYVKDLARAVASNALDLAALDRLEDAQVMAELMKIKGIGQWTAEMFLMFSLGRPDVFSAGDLGLQNAVKRLYRLRSHPDKKKMQRLAAAWKPYRTLAARYLWASLNIELD